MDHADNDHGQRILYNDIETTCQGSISKSDVRGEIVENKADGKVTELVDGEEGFLKERRVYHEFHIRRTYESTSNHGNYCLIFLRLMFLSCSSAAPDISS